MWNQVSSSVTNLTKKSCAGSKWTKTAFDASTRSYFWSLFKYLGTHFAESLPNCRIVVITNPARSREMSSIWAIFFGDIRRSSRLHCMLPGRLRLEGAHCGPHLQRYNGHSWNEMSRCCRKDTSTPVFVTSQSNFLWRNKNFMTARNSNKVKLSWACAITAYD